MKFWNDPLRIYYFLIMDDEDFEHMTPFQGFGLGWHYMHWAMRGICGLPGDVSERSHSAAQVAVQRIAGMRPLMWTPLSISALETLPGSDLPPCFVLFTGQKLVAERATAWQTLNPGRSFHVSSIDGHGHSAERFTLDNLKRFCLDRLEEESALLNAGQREIVSRSDGDWEWPEVHLENYDVKGHNITIPNHMALARMGFTLKESYPFTGKTEEEYTEAILESAVSVALIRREMGDHDIFALGAPPPGVILFEPALYRSSYKRLPAKSQEEASISKAMKLFQQQKGLCQHHDRASIEFFRTSVAGRIVADERADELFTQTLGVGLLAAQTTSPVVRMSPAVNHVFPALSSYARNIRASGFEARRKSNRLFANIQQQLQAALGDDRIEFLSRTTGPVKIVSDAPIEWLPVGNLPLSFARDCSRIPVTPGNLFMGQLVPREPMSLPPEALCDVLVVTSFKEDDRLKNMLSGSLDAVRPRWEGVVNIKQVRVSTVEEFKAALNAFDGFILIFDGHGVANDTTPISKIAIGDEHVDVWSLRGEIRCPPIVILSACDTHGIDASSHATVGNGFIALGARTVLGTFLPVDGRRSAMFIARLMHRIAEYVPAAIKSFKRSLPWTDVVSGMLRMCLATEVIIELVAPPGHPAYNEFQSQANIEINGRDPEWFNKLIDRIASFRNLDRESAERLVQRAVSLADAIRYTQIGNPESIIVSGEELVEGILDKRRRAIRDADETQTISAPT
ncbi:CHAT domain-containing protein [Rhizobium laguerreae]|uniref:CHAT domain-containing protein n=1 Tax=Rhizobium laguerreae TaxID=1076926 RepID=UPI001C8FD135|nr:CHAT domain-containing protein [Rhizobium laguerreae]MBY3330373.1 CHAT domain-containing protein [Rhizobium laguerreae]